jgi:hypothetical protein
MMTLETPPSHDGGQAMAKDAWEACGFRFGPFAVGFSGLGHVLTQTRTETSHILRIRVDPAVKREAINARPIQPGILEIEWPRSRGEDIPVE